MIDEVSATAFFTSTESICCCSRSQLLSLLFDLFNSEQLPFCVLNNFTEMPEVIPTDVDMAIDPAAFRMLDSTMKAFAERTGTRIVQKFWSGNKQCAYVFVTTPQPREYVQFDFCVDFSFNGAPGVLSHKELVDDRSQFRNFSVPEPGIELTLLVIRRLFKNDWSARHCARVVELCQATGTSPLLPTRYTWLQETAKLATDRDLATLAAWRDEDLARVQKVVDRRVSILTRAQIALSQAWRIGRRVRDETGNLSLLLAPETTRLAEAVIEDLNIVFHKDLIVPVDLQVRLGWASFFAKVTSLKLLKLRKGLVLVRVGPAGSASHRLAVLLDKMRLVDQVIIPPLRQSASEFRAPHVVADTPADVVEAIIASQVEKTAQAMARGNTQTSG